jgi:excisionase family DNA binding protein
MGLTMVGTDPPLTIRQVAQRLATSQRRVLVLIADGHLPAVQLGSTARTLRVEVAALERFIDDGGIHGTEADPS